MSEELIVKNTDYLTTVVKSDLSDLIKPLVKEIHLFDTYVAGTSYLEDPSVLDNVQIGDKLALVREANKFDDRAILIRTPDDRKLGYIPEKDNLVFSRLMDAGKLLTARISSHEVKGTFHKIGIGIYLVDY